VIDQQLCMPNAPRTEQAHSDQHESEPKNHKATQVGLNNIEIVWAKSTTEIRQAQQLRHLVFAQEMGARLNVLTGTPPGHDVDAYDAFCEHLLVRTNQAIAPLQHGVIGTYRILTPEAAKRAGGLYCETEFDISPLRDLRPAILEVGRACVHPSWRSGGVILALWMGLTQFMMQHQFKTMMGCVSMSMLDGGHGAASIWEHLKKQHLTEPKWQVQPLKPLPLAELTNDLAIQVPPLLKGYLRCGAKVLGPPSWDQNFDTADFPVMLQLKDVPKHYRKHFAIV
jgi:putative hemolysin